MKAFVEITGLIVRVGRGAERYGDDFEFAYAGVGSGGRLEVKALAGKGGTREHFEAGLRALAPFNFTEITYGRDGGRGQRSLVLTQGPDGEITMDKHIPKNQHGYVDHHAMKPVLEKFLAHHDSGKIVTKGIHHIATVSPELKAALAASGVTVEDGDKLVVLRGTGDATLQDFL